MRLFYILLFSLFFSCSASAQQAKEIGLRATNFDQFSLLYKRETKSQKFLRLRFIFANLQYASLNGNPLGSASFGFAIGLEKRRPLSDRLDLLTGPEPFFNFNLVAGTDADISSFGLGLGYVIGFQYALSDQFHIGIEAIPSVSAQFTSFENEVNNLTVQAGVSNTGIALTGVYRFNKE